MEPLRSVLAATVLAKPATDLTTLRTFEPSLGS